MARRPERRQGMIRKHLKMMIFASLVILLPVAAGVVLWNRLPAQMPTHWNAAGEIDGWSNKGFAVFGLPLILVAAEWLCMMASVIDPKKKGHSEKVLKLVIWIIPVISVIVNALMYATVLGAAVRMEFVMPLMLGLMFVIIGNYLPKCSQNYTIGIKIPWTLHSEENWNRTHRFAGRIWVLGGIVVMLTAFFGGFIIFFGIVLALVLAPMIYSYLLHRRGV